MKKKVIDTNTIEVLMNKNDLKRYKITVLDLLGDHEHVKNFFYHLLKKIDNHQFSANKHLIFKILPNENGLKLIVSKRVNRSVLGFQSKKLNKSSNRKKLDHTFHRDNIIKLKSFENVIRVAHLIKMNNGDSNLYLFHGIYYLELCSYVKFDQLHMNIIKNELSMAYEYGSQTHLTRSFLLKNSKKIIGSNALEVIRHYFK